MSHSKCLDSDEGEIGFKIYCDMCLLLSQVALQRKMLEEYEKRERNRKVGEFVHS